MEHEEILKSLDTLLKGSHMGLTTFSDLLEHLQERSLRDQFRGYVKLFENHEKAITKAILFYHGQPDTESIKIMMGEVMTSLKNLMLVDDKDVLKSASKAIEMGLTQLKEFDDKNLAVTEQVRKDVKIIHDDYESMKHEIHKAQLQREK